MEIGADQAGVVKTFVLRSSQVYPNPFADVHVQAVFQSPSGEHLSIPGFYDGDGTWRVRFCPNEPGEWRYQITTAPLDAEINQQGVFQVIGESGRGFLRATPEKYWGFEYDNGDPAFLLGDTVYNLFGGAFCGADVGPFLQRRADQGFNFLRARLPVSPFHPPDAESKWQTRRTWPWGGSEQSPEFDCFNLEYFQAVDRVVQEAARIGIGFEMIMEAWGFEFPFNSRDKFTAEWEELWLSYLIARYDAYPSVYFWTIKNEYEFYPNGRAEQKAVADRWAMRIARWIKRTAPHGHPVAVHNAPQMPPFAWRFRSDPGAVDAIMFQSWGSIDENNAWLAAGIDEQIQQSFAGWNRSAVMVEYGYERNPAIQKTFPPFTWIDGDHTRRGGWRAAFCGLGVCNGFENTWGPVHDFENDQTGVQYLTNIRRFFTEVVPFHLLRPEPSLLESAPAEPGCQQLAMSDEKKDTIIIYFPAGGKVNLNGIRVAVYLAQWYDPRTGELQDGQMQQDTIAAPQSQSIAGRPDDWVLILRKQVPQNEP
jgi:hypothetical protein